MCRSRTPRVARGAVVASVATFTALLSHVVAGGAVPGPLGILAPWLLALMASTLLAVAPSLVRLGASVLVSQALFHTLFVMGAATPAATMPAMSHHDHGAMSMAMDAAGTARTSGFLAALCADPAMWTLHAVAAVVTVALLYRGERVARAADARGRHPRVGAARRRALPHGRSARRRTRPRRRDGLQAAGEGERFGEADALAAAYVRLRLCELEVLPAARATLLCVFVRHGVRASSTARGAWAATGPTVSSRSVYVKL